MHLDMQQCTVYIEKNDDHESRDIKKSHLCFAPVNCMPWLTGESLVMLGIGREIHYRLSEHISRLIIDCTIEMYVPLTLTSEVIKNAQYLTM